MCLSWNVPFPFALKDGMWGSESEKELFNQFAMYVFPELMIDFAYTYFPLGFDGRRGVWL